MALFNLFADCRNGRVATIARRHGEEAMRPVFCDELGRDDAIAALHPDVMHLKVREALYFAEREAGGVFGFRLHAAGESDVFPGSGDGGRA